MSDNNRIEKDIAEYFDHLRSAPTPTRVNQIRMETIMTPRRFFTGIVSLSIVAAVSIATAVVVVAYRPANHVPTPAISPTVSPSPTVHATPAPTVTQADLIAVAEATYPVTTGSAGVNSVVGFSGCDQMTIYGTKAPNPNPWASCPFTASFKAKLDAANAVMQSQHSQVSDLLCRCVLTGVNPVYTATVHGDGGTAVMTASNKMASGQLFPPSVYTLTIVNDHGTLLVDGITADSSGGAGTGCNGTISVIDINC